MSLKGNLATFLLSSVLQLLCNDTKTGILEIKDGDNKIKVYFKEGTIIYAISSQKDVQLGNILKTQRIISTDEIQKCLKVAKKEKKKIGSILIEKGYISKERLKQIVNHQVREIIYNLFLWEKGAFQYKDASFNLDEELFTPLNTMELVLEASRRIDEWSILKKLIPSDKAVFKISEQVQDKEEIKLNSNEWRILSLIDNRRSAKKVVLDSGYDEFAVYKILYSLISSGLIEKNDEIEIGNETGGFHGNSAIVVVYNDIFQSVKKNIEIYVGKQIITIIAECKSELAPQQQKLFKNFDINNSADMNAQALSKTMGELEDFDDDSSVLIDSFNDFLLGILNKEISLLGMQTTRETLKEIDKLLSYIKKYQKGSSEKIQIVNDMERILAKIESQMKESEKKN